MNQRAQVIPLSADSPRDIGAAGPPSNPRAQRRDNRRAIFAWNANPDRVVLAHASGGRGTRFDLEDIDWDGRTGETEELRQSGGEICAGGEGVEGLRGSRAGLRDAVVIWISS